MCVCVCVCVYICMPRFFMCSSVDGHLGCYHLLAVVNNGAMNIGVPGFKSLFSVPLGIKLEVELLGHMLILCLTF